MNTNTTSSIQPDEYSQHQEVVIHFEDERLRFWLPRDRPLKYLVSAILNSRAFASLNPDESYDLYFAGSIDLTETQTEMLPLPLDLDLLRLAVGERALKLVRQNLSKGWFQVERRDGSLAQIPLRRDQEVGVSKDALTSTHDNSLYFDLRPYAEGEALINISRRHARVIVRDGRYYLRVLHPNGVTVSGRLYEEGEMIPLNNGTRLTFPGLNVRVILET